MFRGTNCLAGSAFWMYRGVGTVFVRCVLVFVLFVSYLEVSHRTSSGAFIVGFVSRVSYCPRREIDFYFGTWSRNHDRPSPQRRFLICTTPRDVHQSHFCNCRQDPVVLSSNKIEVESPIEMGTRHSIMRAANRTLIVRTFLVGVLLLLVTSATSDDYYRRPLMHTSTSSSGDTDSQSDPGRPGFFSSGRGAVPIPTSEPEGPAGSSATFSSAPSSIGTDDTIPDSAASSESQSSSGAESSDAEDEMAGQLATMVAGLTPEQRAELDKTLGDVQDFGNAASSRTGLAKNTLGKAAKSEVMPIVQRLQNMRDKLKGNPLYEQLLSSSSKDEHKARAQTERAREKLTDWWKKLKPPEKGGRGPGRGSASQPGGSAGDVGGGRPEDDKSRFREDAGGTRWTPAGSLSQEEEVEGRQPPGWGDGVAGHVGGPVISDESPTNWFYVFAFWAAVLAALFCGIQGLLMNRMRVRAAAQTRALLEREEREIQQIVHSEQSGAGIMVMADGGRGGGTTGRMGPGE